MAILSRRSLLGAASAAFAGARLYQPPAADAAAAKTRNHPLDGISRENLKITDVKVTIMSYEFPPEKQWVSSTFVVWKSDAVLVQVFTDKGIVGIGESSPYGSPERLKKFIETYVRPALVGKNPFDVDLLTCGWAGERWNAIPWAGPNAALWDIIGKAKNMPVYQLLATDGPAQPHIRMYASGGVEYAWYKRPEDLIDEAVRYKEQGYTAFKFRIGTEWKSNGITVQKFIPYVRKIRDAVGPSMDLMLESNMRLTLAECLEIAPVLEELKFVWFEEPVRRYEKGALEAHIKINQALPTVKVSGGEMLGSRQEFKEWIDQDGYDIVQPDCNVTGLTEAWHIARMAHLKNKPCCPHNWHGGFTTMMNAALVAAIPNRHLLELNQTFNPFKEEVFKDPLVVKRGYMDLPKKPGFGVELVDGLEKKFPYVPGSYSKRNPNLPS